MGHDSTFWNDRNILCLDLNGGYMGVYRGTNSLGCPTHMCVLYCM